MKKKMLWVLAVIVCLLLILLCWMGKGTMARKPFKELTVNEIEKVTVALLPPDEEFELSKEETEELVEILRRAVIYNEDNSYQEYSGQAVIYDITKTDGTLVSVSAYNPFLIIDGVGYRTKYEPCEELNSLGNRIMNQTETDTNQTVAEENQAEEIPDIAEEPLLEGADNGPPSVGLQKTFEGITSCTFATMGTYSWTYGNENGGTQSVDACSSAPTEWEEIATIDMEKTEGELKLYFPQDMVEYSICYWIEGATCGVADPVPMEGDTILLKDEMAKGIYELHVVYEDGDAYYGFKVE